jgi:hypothetical protein
MTEIQIFQNPLFGEVRTLKLPDGQVGFVGKDVATALGYAKSDKAINQYVETDDKLRYQIGTSGQKREMIIIIVYGTLFLLTFRAYLLEVCFRLEILREYTNRMCLSHRKEICFCCAIVLILVSEMLLFVQGLCSNETLWT